MGVRIAPATMHERTAVPACESEGGSHGDEFVWWGMVLAVILEFQSNIISFRNAEETNHLLRNSIQTLDICFGASPELDAIHFSS